jgi:prophage antirepressor-like protein
MKEESKLFRTFFYRGHQIRTVEHNGETWWVASDVCKVLEITNVGQAINGDTGTGHIGLDDDEKDDIRILDAIGRKQATLCVNEPGLYHLISKSRTPEAKAFGRWLRHEVQPALRKTGRYSLAQQSWQKVGLRTHLLSLSKDELDGELHDLRATLAVIEVAYNDKYPHLTLSKDALRGELHYLRALLATVEAVYNYKYPQENIFCEHNIKLESNTKALLQHLDALDRSERFDSRVLFRFIQQEAKSTHTEWMHFVHSHKVDFENLGSLDIRILPDKEEFAMLSIDQGCILLLLGYLPASSSFTTLLDHLHEFRAAYPANRFVIGSLLATFSIERYLNRTLEETDTREEGIQKTEKKLEELFGTHLEAQGITVQYQVRCEVGIADIVTLNAIYELKAALSKSSLQQAVGQVLAYRACINPLAKAIVVGYPSRNEPVDLKFAEAVGVEVIVWTDII